MLQHNRFEGREFPTFGWQANRGQLDARRGTRNEGDNKSKQGPDLQEAPEGNDIPAIDDAAGSILHEEDNRSEQGEGPLESGYTPKGIEQATIADSQQFARFSFPTSNRRLLKLRSDRRRSTTLRETNPKTSRGPRTSKPATPRPTPRTITLPRPTPIPITVVDTPATGIWGSKTTSATVPNQDIRRKGTHEHGLNTG